MNGADPAEKRELARRRRRELLCQPRKTRHWFAV
jgi:hypothetical protein